MPVTSRLHVHSWPSPLQIHMISWRWLAARNTPLLFDWLFPPRPLSKLACRVQIIISYNTPHTPYKFLREDMLVDNSEMREIYSDMEPLSPPQTPPQVYNVRKFIFYLSVVKINAWSTSLCACVFILIRIDWSMAMFRCLTHYSYSSLSWLFLVL